MPLACLDGVVTPAADARLPVTDEGLLRGDGVFEVIRLYEGRPFALAEHLTRMGGSAQNLRLPIELAAIDADVHALLAAQPGFEGALRVVVTRGGHRLALLELLKPAPDVLAVVPVTYAPTRILDGVKSLSYAANMLAGRVAQEQGADEALLTTPHGRVLEAPTKSFFYALDDGGAGGTLYTPPLDDHILDSITRRKLLELVDVHERVTPLDDLAGATEAFLASTTHEVLPVGRIGDRALPVAPGPLTSAAAAAFRAHVEAELAAQ
ncbi:aminotransferase class IV [Svornostia abyssi]|uniref:Aminotransferase class IV n=1 Tax=Svornostia abyssi TaxID=2898438 RepID=A0ABY5PJP5_9ACTN|nr:aminotransferase class IV [Parviterribacteraceae bacterium J379]